MAAKPRPMLTSLVLGSTGAGERTARVVEGLITSNPTLTKINLSRNPNLDADARAWLTQAVEQRERSGAPKLMLIC